MHDTCRVGEQFFKKLKSIDLTNVSSIMMTRPYSMNIGIYSQKIINEFKDFLQAQKTRMRRIVCVSKYITMRIIFLILTQIVMF